MEKEVGVVTIDHDEIRDWVEDRDGRPALAHESDSSGTRLRIVFENANETVRKISWSAFFKMFESENLAFIYNSSAMASGEGTICGFTNREEYVDQLENGGVESEDEAFDEEVENVDEDES